MEESYYKRYEDFYFPESFDVEKMIKDGVNYQPCFEFKACVTFRHYLLDDYTAASAAAFLSGISLILSAFLLILILRHLKVQLKINRASATTSMKIGLMIFIQAMMLLLNGVVVIARRPIDDAWGNVFPHFLVLLSIYMKTEVLLCYMFLDSLLIILLLNDYRAVLFYPIVKLHKHITSKKNAVHFIGLPQSSTMFSTVT